MGFRMRTETRIVVFIYFLGFCQLRKFLLETKDAAAAEYGSEYTDSYGVDYYHDYQKDSKSGYKACYEKCKKEKKRRGCKKWCVQKPSLTGKSCKYRGKKYKHGERHIECYDGNLGICKNGKVKCYEIGGT